MLLIGAIKAILVECFNRVFDWVKMEKKEENLYS